MSVIREAATRLVGVRRISRGIFLLFCALFSNVGTNLKVKKNNGVVTRRQPFAATPGGVCWDGIGLVYTSGMWTQENLEKEMTHLIIRQIC